jgi:hypothetical protein
VDLDEMLYGGDDTEGDVDHSKMANVYNSEVVQLLNRLVDLDEILYGDDEIEDDLDSVLFNPVTSTISKWRTSKLLRRVHLEPSG